PILSLKCYRCFCLWPGEEVSQLIVVSCQKQESGVRIQNSGAKHLGKWRAFPGAKRLNTVSMLVDGRRNDRSLPLTSGNRPLTTEAGSVQELAPMIVWTHLIKDEKHDQRAN